MQQAVVSFIDHAGLGGLFIALVLGNIGAPVGSEVVLPTAGALVATGHLGNLWVAILVAVLAELVGQGLGYAVGRFGGRPLVERYGKYVGFHHDRLDQVHAFFERWGSFAVFLCRFIPVLRGIDGIPAGIAEMDLAPFFLWTALGSTVFCGGLILLGNALGHHLDQILPLFHHYARLLLVVVVAAIVAATGIALLRRKRAA